MIGTKFAKPIQPDQLEKQVKRIDEDGNEYTATIIVDNDAPNTDARYAEAAAWCNETQQATIEDKGDYYEVVAFPDPTEEEQQAALVERFRSAIQSWMDEEAVKLGYDNVLSACSYINTGNPKFDAEGEGFRQWRSAVWAKGYELIDEVISGKREVPDDPADVIALLPELVIVYPESE